MFCKGSPTFRKKITRNLMTSSLAAVLIVPFFLPQNTAAQGKKEMAGSQERVSEQDPIEKGTRALVGREVRNNNNEEIGEIENVIVDRDGKIEKVIVSVGGFWGIGEEETLVPLDKIKLTENRRYVFFDGTSEELESYPNYARYGWAGQRYPTSRTARYDPAFSPVERQRRMNGDIQGYSPADRPGMMGMRGPGNRMAGRWTFDQNRIQVSELLGKKVRNGNEEQIGRVDDVVIGRGGRISLVLSVGQALDMEGKRVQADLQDIRMREDADYILYDVSKEELRQDPGYTADGRTASLHGGAQQNTQQQQP